MSLFYFLAKDGNGFQGLVGRLLTEEYQGTGTSPQFVAVSSQRQRDFGVDGFLTDGVVFQMFFPLQPGLGKVDFPSAVLSKISNTLRKLEENKAPIQKAIGNVVLKLVLVIPEDLSPELRGEVTAKVQEKGLEFEVFGEAKLLNLFSKHINAVRDCLPQFKGDDSADSLNTAAGNLWDKGANDEAKALYSRAYVVALAWNDNAAAAHALCGLGWCAFVARDLPAAMAFAREAGDAAKKCASLHYSASAALVEAKVAFARRDWEEAEKLAQCALDDAVKGNSATRWDAQYTLAEVALSRGDSAEALRKLNLAWRHDLRTGGRRAIAAHDLKAHILAQQGKHRLAVKCLERAASEAKSLGNLVLHAQYLVQSLHVLAGLDEHRKVLASCERCERAAKASGDLRFELEVLMAKAWALSGVGQAVRAKMVLERVATLAEEGSCFGVGARACLALAQKMRESDKLTEARVAVEKASVLAKKSGNPFLCGSVSVEQCEQSCLRSAFQEAAERLREAEEYFPSEEIPPPFTAEFAKLRVRVLDGQGHRVEAVSHLDELIALAAKDSDLARTAEWAKMKRDELIGKIQWFATTRDLLKEKNPLAWAGTDGATSLEEAHQWVLGILIDWWDGIGEKFSPCGVYGMWGEANYGRMLLNHRAFAKKSFHLCVEISSVREARLACRMLSPICDCLTLLWKGLFKPNPIIVPVPFEFEEPIRGWKPRPPKYWDEGARMYGSVMPPLGGFTLPYPIVKFYMEEARDLVAAGRLVLVPGPMVGCLGLGHDDTERMFCDVAAADVVIRRTGRPRERHPLEMVVPWFPSIPMRDLAKLCEDHSECLAELRRKCLEWSSNVVSNQSLLLTRIKAEIGLLSRDIERAFKRVGGAASSGSQLEMQRVKGVGGQAKRADIGVSPLRCEANNRIAAFVDESFSVHPWFPYWSFEQRGFQWQLGAPLDVPKSAGDVPRGAIVNGNVFHWLKAPGEFATTFMLYPKDMEFSDALLSGDVKQYEVKGGKITEIGAVKMSQQACRHVKDALSRGQLPEATDHSNDISKGGSQRPHAVDTDKPRP